VYCNGRSRWVASPEGVLGCECQIVLALRDGTVNVCKIDHVEMPGPDLAGVDVDQTFF
jgi:hypothetical protein